MVKKILSGILNAVSILLILGAVLVLLGVVTTKSGDVPNIMGYSFFRVMTGSMEPTIPTDSVIITHRVDPAEIEVGDVISYFSKDPTLNGAVNTHRVVDIYEENGTRYFKTRGDANNADDLYPPTANQIVGKVIFSSHLLGSAVRLLSNPLVFLPLVLLPLVVLLVWNLVKTFRMAARIARQEEEREIRAAIEAAKQKQTDTDVDTDADAPPPDTDDP